MRNYATLFDSSDYFYKGLAMYESLKKHSSEPFTLYILPIDEDCWRRLDYLRLPNVELVSIADMVHDKDLSALQQNRTRQHWCWTAASQLCEYLMDAGLPEITYLDADLFFFSDPTVVHDEIGDRSIGVIEHRFIPSKRYLEATSGRFNVGWVTFKYTAAGRKCLSTWAGQVRERCDSSTCGDQRYLDSWPEQYGKDLRIIENIGANVAPWNVGNWNLGLLTSPDGAVYPCVNGRMIIFYHFHELLEREDGSFRLTNYELRKEDGKYIYRPYLSAYAAAKLRIEAVHSYSGPTASYTECQS